MLVTIVEVVPIPMHIKIEVARLKKAEDAVCLLDEEIVERLIKESVAETDKSDCSIFIWDQLPKRFLGSLQESGFLEESGEGYWLTCDFIEVLIDKLIDEEDGWRADKEKLTEVQVERMLGADLGF